MAKKDQNQNNLKKPFSCRQTNCGSRMFLSRIIFTASIAVYYELSLKVVVVAVLLLLTHYKFVNIRTMKYRWRILHVQVYEQYVPTVSNYK